MKTCFRFLLLAVLIALYVPPVQAKPVTTPAPQPAYQTLPDGWKQIYPGGDTRCARGTPYSFFVHPGANPEKLNIYFEGGGACWDGETCRKDSSFFQDEVDIQRVRNMSQGVFDVTRPENPLADYTTVMVTYCTGDAHTGSATAQYKYGDEAYTIYHYGFINGSAVLKWVFDNYPNPKQVLVSGCSAGAYGAILFAPRVMTHYNAPDVRVSELGDSGVGVMMDDWGGLKTWGFYDSLNVVTDVFKGKSPEQIKISDLYIAAAQQYPKNTFAEYTTYKDAVQTQFYKWQGGTDWISVMENTLSTVAAAAPNFHYFVAGQSWHCILPLPQFYRYQADGVPFRDWLADLLDGKPIANLHCKNCDVVDLVR